jgi:hypothetical protein
MQRAQPTWMVCVRVHGQCVSLRGGAPVAVQGVGVGRVDPTYQAEARHEAGGGLVHEGHREAEHDQGPHHPVQHHRQRQQLPVTQHLPHGAPPNLRGGGRV